MNPTQLLKLATHAVRYNRSLLVIGDPGCGKTEILVQAALAEKATPILFHPCVEDATDYSGLPALTKDVKGKLQAEHLPFGKLRKLLDAKKPTVAIFDDLITAQPSVQAALMQVVQAREIDGMKLPACVTIFAASNEAKHKTGGTMIISALKTRFDCIVRLKTSAKDWIDWALGAGVPEELVAFIASNEDWLCPEFTYTKEIEAYACPRTWVKLGNWFTEGIKDLEVFTGVVGMGGAAKFIEFLRLLESAPSIDHILMDPENAPLPTSPGIMYAVTAALSRRAEKGNLERVLRYLKRLPKEFELFAMLSAGKLKPALTQTATMVRWYADNQAILSGTV